jgi:hypothetical protein
MKNYQFTFTYEELSTITTALTFRRFEAFDQLCKISDELENFKFDENTEANKLMFHKILFDIERLQKKIHKTIESTDF